MASEDPAPLPPAAGRGLMLDRDREVASLQAALEGLERGEARTVLIEGRAGIGKSRLLAELRLRAEAAGHRVLHARGSELERDFAFGVVRQLFEPLMVEPGARAALLGGAAAGAGPVLDPPAEAAQAGAAASFAALHGLYWLTANAAGDDPLVIAVDDLHWVDHPSLRFLAYLARRLEGLPVLLGAAMRPNEPGSDVTLLGEISQDPATVLLQPRPLDEEAIGAIVQDRLGTEVDRRFRAASHRATGGNPLLLHELVKTMAAEGVVPDAAHVEVLSDVGPRAVSRTVLLRLGRLTPEAARVARAVAVLGEGADLRSVARLAEVSEAGTAEALGALARAEILRPEPPLGFAHPLLRDAVYRELPPGELERAHARAADLLREAHAPPEQVAAHLLVVPRQGDPGVVDLLVDAARRAVGQGAVESAVAYLHRALEEPPDSARRPELLLELGINEIQVNIPGALAHMREAHTTIAEPALRAQAAEGLARSLIFGGDPEEVVTVSRGAQAELAPEAEDQVMVFEALAIVARAFGADATGLQDEVDRARARLRAGAQGPGARMLQAAAAWHVTCRGEEPEAAIALSTEALAHGVLMATDPGFMTPVATASLIFADRPEVMAIWEETLATAHRTGSSMAMLGVYLWRGISLLHRGELDEAEESLLSAFHESRSFGTQHTTAGAYTVAFLSRVHVEQGKLAEARALHELDVAVSPTSDGDLHRRRGLIELLLAEERFEDVLAAADELRSRMTRIVNPAIAPWRSLKAEALDRLGRTDEGVALAHEELEPARRWGAPATVGRALRVLGMLERDRGLAHLEEAVRVTEGTPARLEHAKALTALGAAVRRDRRPSEARDPLRRALELAESCGALPLVETARSELYAAGSRPRSTALSGVDSLTPSERRVADLALEGRTNRDIAQALFVTPKTVEVHLSGAYRKLGIRSRRELAAAMAPAA